VECGDPELASGAGGLTELGWSVQAPPPANEAEHTLAGGRTVKPKLAQKTGPERRG